MIEGVVIGGEEAIAKFNEMPNRLREELKAGIGRAALAVLVRSKEKLSDDVLRVRTGRLRRSVNMQIEESATAVTGSVGTNVEYAHIHEFGFQGVVSVRESLRRSKLGKQFTVRAHTRNVKMPERSFLRSALAEMAPQIRDEFQAAVDRASAAFK